MSQKTCISSSSNNRYVSYRLYGKRLHHNCRLLCGNCLKPVIKEINKQRPTSDPKNMKILHDNARPHVTKTVKSYLDQAEITIIRHPPYSPDLAPSDFWLFDLIKKILMTIQTWKVKNGKLPRFFERYLKKSIKKPSRSG